VLSTQYSVLSTQYSVLSSQFSVLSSQFFLRFDGGFGSVDTRPHQLVGVDWVTSILRLHSG